MRHEGTEFRKLAAIMFTDMVGYSAMAQRDEPLALELLEEHRRLLRGLFPKYQGQEIQTTGDGFLVEFASAVAAVRCAIEIQEGLVNRNLSVPPERKVQIRIGIHVGDVVRHKDGIMGDGVNLAARIEPVARPDSICFTRQVFDQVQQMVGEPIQRLGRIELKNIARPVEVFQISVLPGERSALEVMPQPETKSIAVLPFVNMSPDAENEFLSDGITEELINALSKVTGLRVPARTSAFAFKGKNEDVRKIGDQLNVAAVVEGSLRRAGTKLRITAQLISVKDGYHLWSEKYDREMADVFAVQDEISRAIVAALKVQLGEQEGAALGQHHTDNTDAYQLYLKGRYCWNQRGAGLEKSLHYFELARLEQPDYAPAYCGLADTYNLLAFYVQLSSKEAIPKAKAAARKALQLDDSLAEAHASLGYAHLMYDWDFPSAGQELQRALELNPNYGPARYWHAKYLLVSGREEEAVAEETRAIDLDPLSVISHSNLGLTLNLLRRHDQAALVLCRALELDPNSVLALSLLGRTYLAKGLRAEGLRLLEKAASLYSTIDWVLVWLGHAYAVAGKRDKALNILGQLYERLARTHVSPAALAILHTGLGDRDQAISWLQKAFEEHDLWLTWVKWDEDFDPLRSDPRFVNILRNMGLEK